MNADYDNNVQEHLQEIALLWEAPEDFWSISRTFSLDSLVMKEMIEHAFIKGAAKGFERGVSAGKAEAFNLYSKIK